MRWDWIKNPWVIGGGVVLGLVIMVRGGGSAQSSNIGAALASQELASNTNVALAGIAAQRDVEMASVNKDIALANLQMGGLSKTLAIQALADNLQHDLVTQDIRAQVETTNYANELGAMIAGRQIDSQTEAIRLGHDAAIHQINTSHAAQTHGINVSQSMFMADQETRRIEVDRGFQLGLATIPLQSKALDYEHGIAQGNLAAMQHLAIIDMQKDKNRVKAQSGGAFGIPGLGSAISGVVGRLF